MMSRCFIVNPNAAGGNARQIFDKAISQLEISEKDKIVVCKKWRSIRSEARKALDDNFKRIVAVGGDGTVGQVASAFFHKGKNLFPNSSLAVLPAGTGSDFYRSLALARSHHNQSKQSLHEVVDIFFIRLDHEEIYGINTVSLGITAEIMQRKESLPSYIPRPFQYILATLLTVSTWESQHISIYLNEQLLAKPCLTLLLTKGRYGGGGMKLGEEGQLNSGNFATSFVPPVNFIQFLRYFFVLYRRGLRSVPLVETSFANKAEVFQSPFEHLEVDGEIYAFKTVSIKLLRASLKIEDVCSE